MSQFQSMTADEIVRHFMAEGKVETEGVQALEKHLLKDWVITADEAEMLFQINHKVGQQDDNCPTWSDLYVNAISRFLVFDMNTPGEIAPEEAEWIQKHVSTDGIMSPNEIRLLKSIRRHATKCCDSMTKLFEFADMVGEDD